MYRKRLYAAFTLLELTMVIVVLGILAALAMPRMERDLRQEAGDSILSAIRYAQHMALMDNVVVPTQPRWQRSFWRFGVRSCLKEEEDIFYYVGSDKDMEGNIDNNEAAIDPTNGKRMLGAAGTSCADGVNNDASPDIFLTHKYGIKDTNMFLHCGGGDADAARYIGFDYLGRPHTGFSNSPRADYATLMHADCNLTFKFEDESIDDLIITIEQETGYAYIVGQSNL